jgi:uncharacterized protein (TIGR03000 family)
MYSMVLMAALTTGTDMPDWGLRGGCCGCYGGGWGWGGCYGGWGGCYGGCYGGWGGGYGGYGWGGRYGGWGGGYGAWGGGYGGWAGGYGGWGGYVYAPYWTGTYAAPVSAYNTTPTTTLDTRSMYYNPDTSTANRATIIVHVPESATLTVDGKPTSSTSATRRFYSLPLEAGKSYHYNFVARMERDGKVVMDDRGVDVRAGDRLEITFNPTDLKPTERPDSPLVPDEKNGNRDRRSPVDQR